MSLSLSGEHTHPTPSLAPTPNASAVYIGPPERRLFAWYHPAQEGSARDCAVVLCAPIGNESTGSHRAFRHWAHALAAAGLPTVRFDYHGFGDSPGSPDDADRLRAWLDSIDDAIAFARETSGARRVALAGLHFGATLAMGAAARRGDVDALILWVPYATGRTFLREGRAFTQLMASTPQPGGTPLPPGAEQLGGLMLNGETIEAINAFDPLAGANHLATPTLVIPRDEHTADATLMRNLSSLGMEVEREFVEGYSFVLTEPHQSKVPEAVIATTVEWLTRHFPPRVLPARQSAMLPAVATAVMVGNTRDGVGDAIVESAIHFPTQGENQLFGILSRPVTGPRRSTGVLLVNAGAVYRVGPNRVYVDLARRWAALGYTVLRMDVGGLGDSPTPVGAEENHSYPTHVVDDIEGGIAELRRGGVDRVVVGGLCSGAHATFHAGRELDSVDGMIVINPIVFYWKPTDPLDVGAWKTYMEARHYKRSARSWHSWLRLVQGRVNVPHIAGIGAKRSSEIVKAKLSAFFRGFRREVYETENAARDLARIAVSGTDVFLLFSAGDPGLDFLRLRYGRELRKLESQPSFRLVVIDGADHTFTALGARRRAENALTEHLIAQHP